MSQTYKQSIRAVVWLGHDLVQLVPSRPPYGFEELPSRVEDADMLRSLFHRRYFSRVWVMQELIFAASSMFPSAVLTSWGAIERCSS
ncbi:hypothetical protein RRF57_002378 [Xylaria bambusicola]|uniref:Heterokaryon incompatibility domain-containing protein n=1 Tax=Xylaria bambusicola TaxID=326684 RepID=A0AAN7Z4F0_9PEZI